MTQETIADLNTKVLIGYVVKRGNAWHYDETFQGAKSNHYQMEVPVDDVMRRLLDWHALEGTITATAHLGRKNIVTESTEFKAIMRSDTGAIMGIPKKSYTIHDYKEWLIRNVATLLDADLHIGSAGLLRGGGRAWVTIEMEDTMEVSPKGAEPVSYRPFLTAADSLDQSLASTYFTGAQIPVCDNTLSAALTAASEKVRIKHSSQSLGRIAGVREALGILWQTADNFAAEVTALTGRVVTDTEWNEFTKAYTNYEEAQKGTSNSRTIADRKIGELNYLWKEDERVAPWAGSAYGVLAAVNTHVHHVQTVRNVSRAERNYGRMAEGGFDALDRNTLALLDSIHV